MLKTVRILVLLGMLSTFWMAPAVLAGDASSPGLSFDVMGWVTELGETLLKQPARWWQLVTEEVGSEMEPIGAGKATPLDGPETGSIEIPEAEFGLGMEPDGSPATVPGQAEFGGGVEPVG